MKSKLSAWLASHWPTQESLQGNRWLGWLGPKLFHPHLWRPRRKTLATGLAIGVFFGFLIPLAQIPASAVLATVLRANLPAAMASTLVTNPVTFGPVYYVAYKLGVLLVGPVDAPAKASPVQLSGTAGASGSLPPTVPDAETATSESSWSVFWGYITGVGKPLAVGLVIFAICGSALVYCVANRLWVMRVRSKRRQRLASHQG